MACAISCILSAIFIIGMIYFYNKTNSSLIVKQYKEQLPADLQKRYDNISKERRTISYQGYCLGFVISILIIFYNFKIKKEKMNATPLVCTVIATTFITNYFYYILYPKTDYMLNHINNQQEVKRWQIMYREMQFNYHMGVVLGIIAVGLLAFAFRC